MVVSSPTIKRLSLELGCNAPFIVSDDADLDAIECTKAKNVPKTTSLAHARREA